MRNEALNAGSLGGTSTPPRRSRSTASTMSGGNLGGPIKKNKLFFFYNFENFKQAVPGAAALRDACRHWRSGTATFRRPSTRTAPGRHLPAGIAVLWQRPFRFPNSVIPANHDQPARTRDHERVPAAEQPGRPVEQLHAAGGSHQSRACRNTIKVDWNVSEQEPRVRALHRRTRACRLDRDISNTSGIFPGGSVGGHGPIARRL